MTAAPSSLPLVQPYFAAWTARDPEAVAAAFTEGGTYTGPTVTGPPLIGAAITARALLTSFPDLSFEILGGQPADGGRVITQWLIRGTDTGPWNGQPPAGRWLCGARMWSPSPPARSSRSGDTSTGTQWPGNSASRCGRCRQS